MKRISSLFVGFFLAAGCSTAEPDGNSTDSELKNGKKTPSCEAIGGVCVGLSPASCQDGTWASADTATCGGGIGVGCCVRPTTPPDPCPVKVPTCEAIGGECVGLSPASCQDGTWAAGDTATCGDGIGVGCCVRPPPPPEKFKCEAKGGRCTGLSPSSCPEGIFATAGDFDCGTGIGVGCCVACPTLSPPGPGFCPDGDIVPNEDEAGCVRGYTCVKKKQ